MREVLADTSLFERLDDTALDALVASTSIVEIDAGDVIVREDEPGDALFVILSGAVQIFKVRDDGTELVIARCEAGDFFGEQALLPGPSRVRNASVRALEDVRLCRIEKPAFQAVLASDHPLKEHLLDASDEQLIDNLALESRMFRALDVAGDDDATERTLAAGEIVFAEGDPATALFLVLDGEIEIFHERNEDGDRETLAVLGPGMSFGELGILEDTDRAASARAVEPSRLAVVPAHRFRAWQARSPELRELFRALRRVYRLPNRGRLSQSTGTFLGREAVTNVYELADGRTVVVSLVVGDDLYNGDVVGKTDPAIATRTFTDGPTRRQLRMLGDRVIGITAHGAWPALAELQRRMLDDESLDASLLAGFEQTGAIAFDDAPRDGMVCSCTRVDRKTLATAIANGASRLAQLQAKTGCGTVCGSCVPAIKKLLGNEQWAAVQIDGERRFAAREVVQLRLRPVDRAVVAAQPGQHVILSGLVDGEWMQRAYTLSSACSEKSHYEITVKREPDGQFSTWLFDHAGDDTMLRLSPPRGEYWWRPTGRAVVFVVAGIGITPALAVVRSAVREGWTDRIHVDCSARSLEDIAARDELETLHTPTITMNPRITTTTGRIAARDIDELVARFPDADFYLCGPATFMTSVADLLRRANVPGPRIRIETFTHAAATPIPIAPRPPPPPKPQPPPSLRGLIKSLFGRG